MQQQSADALVLAVLCDFKETEPRAVVHEILTRLMAIQQDDFKTLREYVSMLEILATNRNLNLDIQQEFEMLEIEIEKLPSFLIGQERSIEQGIEQGAHNKAIMIAKQLLGLNMSLTEIAQITGLTTDELEKLD
jgi:predicted transposase/invertase (TIGR01784 family)